MPKQTTHVGTVREWLTSLGILTAVTMTREEANSRLAAYLPMIMHDGYPDAAFTTDSLNYVARQSAKGFPTYPELANHLSAHWREHRPYIALPPPDIPPPRPDPTPEERAYVSRVVAETLAFLQSCEQPVEDRRPVGPRHLSPEDLDRLNPLPNGRKRTDATHTATPPAELSPRWDVADGELDTA